MCTWPRAACLLAGGQKSIWPRLHWPVTWGASAGCLTVGRGGQLWLCYPRWGSQEVQLLLCLLDYVRSFSWSHLSLMGCLDKLWSQHPSAHLWPPCLRCCSASRLGPMCPWDLGTGRADLIMSPSEKWSEKCWGSISQKLLKPSPRTFCSIIRGSGVWVMLLTPQWEEIVVNHEALIDMWSQEPEFSMSSLFPGGFSGWRPLPIHTATTDYSPFFPSTWLLQLCSLAFFLSRNG
jgi:hypothetical protein